MPIWSWLVGKVFQGHEKTNQTQPHSFSFKQWALITLLGVSNKSNKANYIFQLLHFLNLPENVAHVAIIGFQPFEGLLASELA